MDPNALIGAIGLESLLVSTVADPGGGGGGGGGGGRRFHTILARLTESIAH